MVQPDLELLLEDLKEGRMEALDTLYRLYYPSLYAVAYSILRDRFEAQEVVNDCFIEFWERKAYKNVTHRLDSFLYVIVKRKCAKRIEKIIKLRSHKQEFFASRNSPAFEEIPVPRLDAMEPSLIAVLKCFNDLPNIQHQTVQMAKIEKLSIKGIARKQHVSVNTVKTNLKKGIKNMKKYFKKAVAG